MRLAKLIAPAAPPVCVACDGWAGRAEPLCGACRTKLRWLGSDPHEIAADLPAWAPLAYGGPARDVVAALKFRGATRAAAAMAAAICALAPSEWLDDAAALIPVPLHPARRRKRGFNQAERLGRKIADRTGASLHDVLARAGPRATQMGRSRRERFEGIHGTIELRTRPPPQRVVLIDDVMTTGATLAACAQALREAGTTEVKAIAYARTPGR